MINPLKFLERSVKKLSLDTSDDMVGINENGKSIKSIKNIDRDDYIKIDNEGLTGIYRKNLNILQIHDAMLSKLRNQCSDEEKNKILRDIEIENKGLMSMKTKVEKNAHVNRINELKIRLFSLHNNTSEYLNDTGDLLTDFRSCNDIDRRLMIIRKYLEICKKYVKIDIINVLDIIQECKNCGTPLSSMPSDMIESALCPECGSEINFYGFSGESQEIIEKDDSKDLENFHKALIHYIGRSDGEILNILFPKLDAYFQALGTKSRFEIANQPLLPNGKREGTGVKMMLTALKAIGCSNLYSQVYMICNDYWSWSPPLLSSEQISIIISDYILSQKVLNDIRTGRKTMNIPYRLYRHLERVGHPCVSSDFKIVSSPNILDEHERDWMEVCRRLNWKIPMPLPRKNG